MFADLVWTSWIVIVRRRHDCVPTDTLVQSLRFLGNLSGIHNYLYVVIVY